MGKIVLDFSNFINEHKRFDETLTWSQEYRTLFSEFPFEEGIISLIDSLDRKWTELKNKYNWGRESRYFPSGHFAMDVKVYIWPDHEKAKEALAYPSLSEEGLYNWWYRFLNDQREALVDGIDYSWVKDVGFGGKSGGWLVVVPHSDDNDYQMHIEAIAQSYQQTKESAKSEDGYEDIAQYVDLDNYEELVRAGMITEPHGISELRDEANTIKTTFGKDLEELNRIDPELQEVLARVEKFKTEGLELFYDYLREYND